MQYLPFNTPSFAGAGLDPTANFDPDFFTNSSLVNPVLAINNEYRGDKRRTFNMGGTAAFNITNNLIFRSTGGFDITYADLSTFNGLYSPTIRQGGRRLPEPAVRHHHDGRDDDHQQLERAGLHL